MTPQALATALSTIVVFAAGILSSRGIISKETQDYLAGPETLAFLGVLCTAGLGGWALWANRPHGLIASANALPQVDAVVVKPKTAGEMQTPGVVGSVEEAAEVVKAPRHRAKPVPPVATGA